MPITPHVEKHFTGSEFVRDVVIGMADGLTVPFALAAGLSAAVTSTHIIVTAGLAEVAAGAIAMGLGGYLAARTDEEHYASEERREYQETEQLREVELEEVAGIFRGYGLEGQVLQQVTGAIAADPRRWVDFMMRFELGLERPDPKRAPISALTIAISYIFGGLHSCGAVYPWVGVTSGSDLFRSLHRNCARSFWGREGATDWNSYMAKSAFQTMLVGGVAAGAAFYLARRRSQLSVWLTTQLTRSGPAQPEIKIFSAPAQAANATTINPGITRRAKERPPPMPARNILLIVLVESPARIGKTASAAFIFPDATSEATEIAAEWVSTKPARVAATIMPASPNHSRSAAEATRMLERVKANTKAVERLKARPLCASPSVFCRRARIAKTIP